MRGVNTLTVVSFVRAHNPGLTPGRGAFLGAYSDGVNERAVDARRHFVTVKVLFSSHEIKTVGQLSMQGAAPLGSASAWLADKSVTIMG